MIMNMKHGRGLVEPAKPNPLGHGPVERVPVERVPNPLEHGPGSFEPGHGHGRVPDYGPVCKPNPLEHVPGSFEPVERVPVEHVPVEHVARFSVHSFNYTVNILLNLEAAKCLYDFIVEADGVVNPVLYAMSEKIEHQFYRMKKLELLMGDDDGESDDTGGTRNVGTSSTTVCGATK